ncbi:MAG: hypothetical protein K0Q73_4494 [Paenibacillus sp.]|jgi:hypothetical protein|nr:hypothetical protein [Paenibacillus sp.]
MNQQLLKRLTYFTVLGLLASMLLPVLTYASTLYSFYFNLNGKLSGGVYVKDPSKVSIQITQGDNVTTVTYGTYLTKGKYTMYDDQNVPYSYLYLSEQNAYGLNLPINEAPTSIAVNYDGAVTEVTYNSSYSAYVHSTDIQLSPIRRMNSTMDFSTVTGSTYLPADIMIARFTPSLEVYTDLWDQEEYDVNGIEITLPNGSQGSSKLFAANLALSDFRLMDETVQQELSLTVVEPAMEFQLIEGVGYGFAPSTKALSLRSDQPLHKNHTYALKLSSTADKEILLPPAGNGYSAMVKTGVYLGSKNMNSNEITYLSNVAVGTNTGTSNNNSGSFFTGVIPLTNTPTVAADGSVSLEVKPILSKGEDGRQTAKLELDSDQFEDGLKKLKDNADGVFKISTTQPADIAVFSLSGSQLISATSTLGQGTLVFETPMGAYQLPVSLFQAENVAKSLGVNPKDVTIEVQIAKSTVQVSVSNATVIGQPLDFSIRVVSGGRTMELNDFDSYVSRSIALPSVVDPATVTAVVYDPATGLTSFVPAVFTTVDGHTVATVKRKSNSTYAVLKSEKSFADLKSHWAATDVNLLASKLIIQGTSETTFAPDSQVTRGQFATLLVRALGLKLVQETDVFKDVVSESVYSSSIAAAQKAGLIQGYEDGTFQPDAAISREQMAVIIQRAIAFAGASVSSSGSTTAFADQGSISVWAAEAVKQAVQAGVIQGMEGNLFNPERSATRAETAVMLKRVLVYLEFINK